MDAGIKKDLEQLLRELAEYLLPRADMIIENLPEGKKIGVSNEEMDLLRRVYDAIDQIQKL